MIANRKVALNNMSCLPSKISKQIPQWKNVGIITLLVIPQKSWIIHVIYDLYISQKKTYRICNSWCKIKVLAPAMQNLWNVQNHLIWTACLLISYDFGQYLMITTCKGWKDLRFRIVEMVWKDKQKVGFTQCRQQHTAQSQRERVPVIEL